MAINYHHPLDRTFHALGDGTRREILSMLSQTGPMTATELRRPFDAAQPTISKHLKVLEKAGLVRREIQGRTHRFALQPGPFDEAQDWLARHRSFWSGTLEQLDRFVTGPDHPTEDPS